MDLRKRFLNQTAITGYGSLILALVPYFVDGANMNLTTWILAGVGTVLVLYGAIHLNKTRTYLENKAIMEQRNQYLPQLREAVNRKLVRMSELSKEAGKLSLEQYYDKYLARNKEFEQTYRSLANTHKDEKVRRKVAIVVSLIKLKFCINNVYLSELIHDDNDSQTTDRELETYISLSNDTKLNGELRDLFKISKTYYSTLATAELGLNNEFPYKLPKYKVTFFDAPNMLKSFLTRQHKAVNERIGVLVNGDDL